MPDIETLFWAFHKANPQVFQAFLAEIDKAITRGLKRIGAKNIFEYLRWEAALKTSGKPYKLNNNYFSFYVRLAEKERPACVGMFEKRIQKSKKGQLQLF